MKHDQRCGSRGAVFAFVGLLSLVSQALRDGLSPASDASAARGERAPAAPATLSGGRHALLIGCTKYDRNLSIKPLQGPANDVKLVRKVLEDQFQFPPQNIVILSEESGGDRRPVRKSIEREFKALARRAKKGDQVFILMSGHGSQQPNDNPETDIEPDGLDEIFLPADVGSREETTKYIPNAIVDDELGAWTRAIAANGAHVFLVIDACHSGTMLRDADDVVEVSRNVPAEILVPQKQLEAAREQASRQQARAADSGEGLVDGQETADGVVALYAAKSDETAPERLMDDGSGTRKFYGLCTYHLCKLLVESAQGESPLIYRELGQRLQSQYLGMGRYNGPTPFAEGTSHDLDRTVLGTAVHRGRSRILLARHDDGWTINAGRLHGVTKGSILEVYPEKGPIQSSTRLGYVSVVESRVIDSIVAPTSFADTPEAKLPSRGRCNLVTIDMGDLRIPIAIGKEGVPQSNASETRSKIPEAKREREPSQNRDRLAQLESELVTLGKQPDSYFRITTNPAEAKWVIRPSGSDLLLLPSDAAQLRDIERAAPGAPIFRLNEEKPAADLTARMARIARVQNLLAISHRARENSSAMTGAASDQASADSEAPRMSLQLVRCANARDRDGKVIQPQGAEIVLHDGDYVAFRVTNEGRVPVEFTLLFIDSQFNIEAIYPRGGAYNVLPPNPGSQPFQTRAFRVNGKTIGHEQLLAIAITSERGRPPVDFTFLAEHNAESAKRSIESTRGFDGRRSFDSPLGQLLRSAMFREGATRGLSESEANRHDVQLVSWRVSNSK